MEIAQKTTDVRRFRRVLFRNPVKIKIDGRQAYAGSLAQDLSRGGIRFFSHDFISVNSGVMVQVQLEHGSRLLELSGRVAWVRDNPLSQQYQVGLEFGMDKPRACEVIGQYVVEKCGIKEWM